LINRKRGKGVMTSRGIYFEQIAIVTCVEREREREREWRVGSVRYRFKGD